VEQERAPGAVTIDQNGVAHAVKPGTAVVRITSRLDPAASVIVAVTVE
jgi:hypothetical protein